MPLNTSEERSEIQRIWNTLLDFALWKHVPFHDAKDLVQECLHKALQRFDHDRGELLPFARTILSNAIKNYWRDQRTELLLDPYGEEAGDPGPIDLLVQKESNEAMLKMLEKLKSLLSLEELRFLEALGEALHDTEKRAISEAARRSNLKPLDGWNIFRRIQRKAKSIGVVPSELRSRMVVPSRALPEAEKKIERGTPIATQVALVPPRFELRSRITSSTDPGYLLRLARFLARTEAFESFLKSI